MDNDSWLAIPDEMALFSYCIVGSFVTFLIEKYGKEKFKELYQETDRENTAEKNKKIFKEIYGVSIDEIEKLWKKGF